MNFKTALLSICILLSVQLKAQDVPEPPVNIDSLQNLLSGQIPDTIKLKVLNTLSNSFNQNSDFRRGMQRANEALSLSRKMKNKRAEGDAYENIANSYQNLNIPPPGKDGFNSFKKFHEKFDSREVPQPDEFIDANPEVQKNFNEALKNLDASLKIREEVGDKKGVAEAHNSMGEIYLKQGKYDEAVKNILQSVKGWEDIGKKDGIAKSYVNLGNINIKLNKPDEARQYLQKSVEISRQINDRNSLANAYNNLSYLDDKQGNYKQAYEYYKLYTLYRDSIDNIEISKKFQQAQLQHDYEIKEANLKAAQAKKDAEIRRARNIQYFIIGSLGVIILAVLVIVLIQYRNNRQKHKTNLLLQVQKEKVESTLSELKSTQAHLIQSEKMASLGVLTAGIAHEIRNPLNFVNNFSEVNKELLLELKEEIKQGNLEEVKIIANDVMENEEKINHHGKRANEIVKEMLLHSTASSGQKELTDINLLTDEYLRLSYHGFRAKNNSLSDRQAGFNPNIETHFDRNAGEVKIIPQDIGRVLLNLFNNAFYAVHEKYNLVGAGATAGNDDAIEYKPTIIVTTKRTNKFTEISVKDNGNGIPQKVKDKIFQPFFTTKPPGEGTGLGLSLSYDIIKAHGGELTFDTHKMQGTEFKVLLPS